MQVQPYLYFNGRCEEAINFYRLKLGAELKMLMRFSENPDAPQDGACAGDMASIPGDKVMHAAIMIGESEMLVSDGMSAGKTEFKGVSLALSPATDAEARRIFTALSDGGQVRMPLAPTFFSGSFGMLDDKFGVSWLIVGPGPKPQA